ncbi:GTPase-activating protein RNA1 [Cyberlindnera jadinii NRRL Y-1542]|uniref:RNI-like protein n=1 Tax=Cyberlindnera jadinii (strain ATCC 18201 / CBS 1600 / BCRC 20928 / JCM 3617 / NBRC 0987 / NRRL Y-1542) TaxID=983966 RepID=A0A1E4S803_CYBJN|nr:RNI-like protein [Cyberlindnera jadinii NRRL Y-1542]ODV75593.1 RNI-like protein [Cyberlindnera jadinii NRRL Y-1542]
MASLDFTPQYKDDEVYSLAGKALKFDTHKDIEPYLKELDELKNVKKIDFSGNTIGIDASKHLADSLKLHKDTLEEVNFSDLFTGRLNTEIPQSLDYLLPALLDAPKLHIINLSDNAFGLQTIEPVERFLPKAVYLEHLILSNNGMGPFAGERIGKCLYKLSLNKKKLALPSLKTFICGRNRLENGSTTYLSIGLKAHADLQVVKLYQNGIRPQGIARLITQGLKHNSQLTIIDLQDNTITKRSAKILADHLSSWKNLKELNVNDCLLNPLGSLELAKALKGGDVLENFKVLKLQYNELDQEALELLKDAISDKLPNLELLELNGNRFEEENNVIDEINAIFEDRGVGELDELDDLEELDSDEDETDSEKEESEEEIEAEILEKELEQEQEVYTPDNNDKDVTKLAEELEKATI